MCLTDVSRACILPPYRPMSECIKQAIKSYEKYLYKMSGKATNVFVIHVSTDKKCLIDVIKAWILASYRPLTECIKQAI